MIAKIVLINKTNLIYYSKSSQKIIIYIISYIKMAEINCKLQLENDIEFPYKECKFQDIQLKKYFELPQDATWSQPRMALNRELVGAKCSLNNIEKDIVFIWSVDEDNLGNKPIYEYESSSILTFDFSPSSTSFIIVYKGKAPVHYNVKSGHKICELETKGETINTAIAWAFSPQGRFFALATENHFYVWDVLTSKLKIDFEEKSPMKYLRNNILITLNNNNNDVILNLISIQDNKSVYKVKLPHTKSYNEIMACMINEDNSFVYYATKTMVYKISIKDGKCEDVVNFEETDPKKVFIASNCKQYFSTNNSNLNFWEEKKGLVTSLPRQKFKEIFVALDNNLMTIIDDISITLTDYTKYAHERDLFKIYTDVNVTKFKWVKYSSNSLFVLCLIDDHSAALYNCVTGRLIHKWINHSTRFWSRALELVPVTATPTILALKSGENLIEIWDYTTGTPVAPLEGFNAYDLKFNDSGNLLIAGTMGGKEVARIWDIDIPSKPYIYKTNGGEKNEKTVVYLTNNKQFLICHSINQNPIIFDAQKREIVINVKSDFTFSDIENIYYSEIANVFISHGKGENKNEVAVMWKIDTGDKIKQIDNCEYIQVSNNGRSVMYKTKEQNEEKLIIDNIDDNQVIKGFEMHQITANEYAILNDSASFVLKNKLPGNQYKMSINDIQTGKMFGSLEYDQGDNQYAELDMFVDSEKNIYLRKLMFEKNF